MCPVVYMPCHFPSFTYITSSLSNICFAEKRGRLLKLVKQVRHAYLPLCISSIIERITCSPVQVMYEVGVGATTPPSPPPYHHDDVSLCIVSIHNTGWFTRHVYVYNLAALPAKINNTHGILYHRLKK